MHRWLLVLTLCASCTTTRTSREPRVASSPSEARGEREPVVHGPEPTRTAHSPSRSEPPRMDSRAPAPLTALDQEALEQRVLSAPESLGSLSLGTPNAGALFNGVQLAEDQYFAPVDPNNAWGTQETIMYLRAAAARVHAAFPECPPLHVGHLSARRGGPLSPHHSHQSGRDVDLGYYYKDEGRWYRRATLANLDVPRTWSFVRALVVESDVEMILMDAVLIAGLRRFALEQGEDPGWVASLFEDGPRFRAIVRHARGHATHMHIRFHNPVAQQMARRVYPLLVEHELVDRIEVYRYHRVRKGETLGKLAKRYGTTVLAIKRANGLRTSVIQAKKQYRIPTRALDWYADAPFEVPPRRLPPAPNAASHATDEELEHGG